MRSWHIPRRSFLKGAGISLLLPALDIMTISDAMAAEMMGPRFAAVFMPAGIFGCGYNPAVAGFARYTNSAKPAKAGGQGTWRPKNFGPFQGTLPLLLQALEDYRNKFSIVTGFDYAGQHVNHANGAISWLTGPSNVINQASTPNNSIDQAIANYFNISYANTLVFSSTTKDFRESERGHGGRISANTKAGGNHTISPSTDPWKKFDLLIAPNCKTGGSPTPTPVPVASREVNVLDTVSDQIKALNKKLSADDKVRMEAFYEQVQSIQSSYKGGGSGGGDGTLADGTCPTKPAASTDWYKQVCAMVDVTAFALATDIMPISTIMTDIEAVSERDYAPWVNDPNIVKNFKSINGNAVKYPSGAKIHTIAHFSDGQDNNQARLSAQETADNIECYIAYNIMQMSFVHRLIDKLDKLPKDPNGLTPLENSIILAGAAHGDGASHASMHIPTLIAGGKRYGFKTGIHHQVTQYTHIGNLHYTLMKKMGCNITDFNSHKSLLSGLFT